MAIHDPRTIGWTLQRALHTPRERPAPAACRCTVIFCYNYTVCNSRTAGLHDRPRITALPVTYPPRSINDSVPCRITCRLRALVYVRRGNHGASGGTRGTALRTHRGIMGEGTFCDITDTTQLTMVGEGQKVSTLSTRGAKRGSVCGGTQGDGQLLNRGSPGRAPAAAGTREPKHRRDVSQPTTAARAGIVQPLEQPSLALVGRWRAVECCRIGAFDRGRYAIHANQHLLCVKKPCSVRAPPPPPPPAGAHLTRGRSRGRACAWAAFPSLRIYAYIYREIYGCCVQPRHRRLSDVRMATFGPQVCANGLRY